MHGLTTGANDYVLYDPGGYYGQETDLYNLQESRSSRLNGYNLISAPIRGLRLCAG